jgi:hypothetical protein
MNNVLYNTSDMSITSMDSMNDIFKNNLTLKNDPGFKDLINLDFNLKNKLIIYIQVSEFSPILLNKIGLYKS